MHSYNQNQKTHVSNKIRSDCPLDQARKRALDTSSYNRVPALNIEHRGLGCPHTSNVNNVGTGKTRYELLNEGHNNSDEIGLLNTLRLRSSWKESTNWQIDQHNVPVGQALTAKISKHHTLKNYFNKFGCIKQQRDNLLLNNSPE